MTATARTQNITRALFEIAANYGFRARTEVRLHPECGRHSERLDVAFLLPSGRKVFWFEIDSQPARAGHNRLKLFGDAQRCVPITELSIYHGRAASHQLSYPNELLTELTLPPRFLDSISVEADSSAMTLTALQEWFDRSFSSLRTAIEWGTVLDISAQYQPLLTSGGVHLASAHLEAQAELGWFLLRRGLLGAERATALTVSLVRMLQRAGYHRRARWHIRRLDEHVDQYRTLSTDTSDAAKVVTFLLRQPRVANTWSPSVFQSRTEDIRTHYYRSQLLWRTAIPLISGGERWRVEEIILQYLDLLSGSPAARSNVALLRAMASLTTKTDDSRVWADRYARHENFLLEGKTGAPDGTFHGLLTALYLQTITRIATGGTVPAPLLEKLDRFRRSAGVPFSADGLREITHLFGRPLSARQSDSVSSPLGLVAQAGSRRLRALNSLYAEISLLCAE